jgi:hypothetical protein
LPTAQCDAALLDYDRAGFKPDAISAPASAFASQVNRVTSETLRVQATQEGLVPLKAWIKSALDQVVQVYLGAPDLKFVTAASRLPARMASPKLFRFALQKEFQLQPIDMEIN